MIMKTLERKLFAAVLLAASVGCNRTRVPSAPTAPRPIPTTAIEPLAGLPAFKNLTHPTISPYWGRAKADGEEKALNVVTSSFGINWIPVVPQGTTLTKDTRLPKETVCGTLEVAELFIADEPTSERDWNLIISPSDKRFISDCPLSANAGRLRQLGVDLSVFFSGSGKFLNTSFWHRDHYGTYLLEAELTAPRALLLSMANPFPCLNPPCSLHAAAFSAGKPQPLLKPKELCAYGPYVQEAIHGFRPEIHPSEGLWFRSDDGAWHLIMALDASKRFDASSPGTWFTVFGPPISPQNKVEAEHWVQEAMVGEFVLPLEPAAPIPKVEIIAETGKEMGLESIGTGGYPPNQRITGGIEIANADSRLAVTLVTLPSGQRNLVIRAQIRGAPSEAPLSNEGAFLHLRVK